MIIMAKRGRGWASTGDDMLAGDCNFKLFRCFSLPTLRYSSYYYYMHCEFNIRKSLKVVILIPFEYLYYTQELRLSLHHHHHYGKGRVDGQEEWRSRK